MKNVILFLYIPVYCLLILASQRVAAQPEVTAGGTPSYDYRVSTESAPAHILLEEFTGLHCSYCPQAHAIANNLTYVAGDRVHVMAVHVGHLAAPNGDEVDLRAACGETFYAWQGEGGMPSGNINRTVYPECGRADGYSLYRSEWAAVAKRLLASEIPAPLNLYVEARLDTANGNIYIVVEAYAAVSADRPLYLNVALTENFVPGTQAGSNLRTYLHRHVLRDMVTGVTGDTLKSEETVQGAYLRRDYIYKLPEKFNNRTPNPANLACLVFVTDSAHAVLNSTETDVESPFKATLDYLQIDLHNLEKTYGGPVYEVYVVNPSDDTLRSLTFTFDLNGDTRTYRLDGLCLLPKTESVVGLETDFDAYKFQKTNVYTLRLTEANGRAVESNQIKDKFSQPLTLPAAAFKVAFTSDLYGSESTVSLTNERGEALYEAGPFADGECKTYTSGLFEAVAGAVYTFRVTDAFRDGANRIPANGAGFDAEPGIRLLTETDSVFYKSGIGVYGHLISFRLGGTESDTLSAEANVRVPVFTARLQPNPAQTQTVLQVEGLDPDAEVRVSIYNLQGHLMETRCGRPQATAQSWAGLTLSFQVSDYPQGLYLVRMEQNGLQQVIKLIIKQ